VHLLAEKLAQLITDRTIVPSDTAWYNLVSSKKDAVDGLDLMFLCDDHRKDGITFLLPELVEFLFTGSFASGIHSSLEDTFRKHEKEQKQILTNKKQNTKKKEGNTRKKDLISDEAEVTKSDREGKEEEEEEEEELGNQQLHEYTTYFQDKMSALFKPNKNSQKIRDIEDAVEEGKRQEEVDQIFNSTIMVTKVMIEALALVKNAAAVAKKQKLDLFKNKKGSYENLVKTTFQQLMESIKKDKKELANLTDGVVANSTLQQKILVSEINKMQNNKKQTKGDNNKSVTLDSILEKVIDERYCFKTDELCFFYNDNEADSEEEE